MPKFLDLLRAEQVEGTDDDWMLLADLRYERERNGAQEIITVKAGYTTDYATVPQLFWSLIPKSGKYDRAAVIHDFIYGMRGKDVDPARSRMECDGIFMEAMKCLGVELWKRYAMWVAVRSFGWMKW